MLTREPLNRRAFTLVELLVVIGIVALLLAIALPVIGEVRKSARLRAAQSQLEAIGAACESYASTYGGEYPGHFANAKFAEGANRNSFSETENLVLSLMGQVNNKPLRALNLGGSFTLPTGYHVDLDAVGAGPMGPTGRPREAFYTPKNKELVVVEGAKNDNDMPEFVDPASGMPVLYYRLSTNVKPVADDSVPGGSASGRVGRENNAMYLDATDLVSTKGNAFNQSAQSMLSSSLGSSANRNLAWLLIEPEQSDLTGNDPNNDAKDVIAGGFVLLSSGTDGVYFDKNNNPDPSDTTISDLDELERVKDAHDDPVFIGGTK